MYHYEIGIAFSTNADLIATTLHKKICDVLKEYSYLFSEMPPLEAFASSNEEEEEDDDGHYDGVY